ADRRAVQFAVRGRGGGVENLGQGQRKLGETNQREQCTQQVGGRPRPRRGRRGEDGGGEIRDGLRDRGPGQAGDPRGLVQPRPAVRAGLQVRIDRGGHRRVVLTVQPGREFVPAICTPHV